MCILPTPVPVVIELNQWERQSQSLKGHVNVDAKRAIAEFLPYFSGEEQALGDPTLKQDEDILRKLMQQ